MAFELTGQLHLKYETEQVSATFKKRDFIVKFAENPTYPQFPKFQITQDKCAFLDSYQVGDPITVSFNVEGREWTDPKTQEKKYFTSLNAWRIQPAAGAATPPPPAQDFDVAAFSNDDDLPF